MNQNVIAGSTIDNIAGQLAVQTASPLTLGSTTVRQIMVRVLHDYEATDHVARVDPMSLADVAIFTVLDSAHNPLLGELWRDDLNDDLVVNP